MQREVMPFQVPPRTDRLAFWAIITLCAVTCSLSCSDDDPGHYIRSDEVEYSELNCGTDKSDVQLDRIRVPVTVTSTPSSDFFCRLSFEPDGEGVLAHSDIRAFNVSTVLEFTNIYLAEGIYIMMVRTYSTFNDAQLLVKAQSAFSYSIRVGGADCDNPVYTRQWQVQYDSMIDCDIRDDFNLDSELQIEFGAASTQTTVQVEQAKMPNTTFTNLADFELFVLQRWESNFGHDADSTWLAAIEDIFPRYGFFGASDPDVIVGASGFTRNSFGENGEPGAYSVILRGGMDNQFFTWDMSRAVRRTTIHELGHARGGLKHQQRDPYVEDPNHKKGFDCIMVASLETDSQGNLIAGWYHFCPDCLSNLEKVIW